MLNTSNSQGPKLPRVRHARQSIAHTPSAYNSGIEENATVSGELIAGVSALEKQAVKKKNRSKSIGPGGLDALKESSGNKQDVGLRKQSPGKSVADLSQPIIPPYVKSILKPTIALSPPKAIPPHNRARNGSPGKGRQTPETSPRKSPGKKLAGSVTQGLPNPFETSSRNASPARSPKRVAVRSEEEQQAAAKERERQEILANRDARRKSLANRRVSFAPEATLHTWNVVELPEDSTTSSASTNATRRASALTANAGSPYPTPRSPVPSDASEPPSTPPEQIEELQVAASPAPQRNLHQKKSRRSSGIPPMNFNNPDEFSSSPYSGASDDTGSQAFVTADEDSDSSSNNDNDLVQDETVTGVDGDDNTIRSTGGSSTESSERLEAALQQAANQAGTQGIDYDEHGDITMEMADEEVTNAFQPWMKKGKYVPQVMGDPSSLQDQENLNPFSPAFKANVNRRLSQVEDGTMEMTQAVGRILPATKEAQASPNREKVKPTTGSNRRRSGMSRRRSSGDGSALGDETMDLTTAIGGIEENRSSQGKDNFDQSDDEDEELTMEFTSVVGGVVQPSSKNTISTEDELPKRQLFQAGNRRESMDSSKDEEEMDITFAAGGILPSITERTEPVEDQTQGMDMDITTAVGAILPEQLNASNKAEAKILMEQETDVGQLSGSPLFGTPRQKPLGVGLSDERPLPALRASQPESLNKGDKTKNRSSMEKEKNFAHLSESPSIGTPRQKPVGVGLSDERALPAHARTMASETGSPGFASSQIRSQPRVIVGRQSVTPKSQQPTPIKKPNTPSKQLTPQIMRPTTPGKTPPSKNVSMRTASPKKLFKVEIKEAKKTPDSTPRQDHTSSLFRKDLASGVMNPSMILKPRRRRSSGLGVDREGLGSPRVTALLDRRGSIGNDAKAFVAQTNSYAGVRFEDPHVMEQELEQERAEDKRRESGRDILEAEADTQDLEDKDHTANLKDMIERLTPQKRKLNGRKSLHVGAAKGLLGKRPVELDEDEDEDGTPKRVKGREGSPMKKVKLPAPPPKTATIGRVRRSSRLSLTETAGNARASTPSSAVSPLKTNTTPKDQPRFKDTESRSPAKVQPFEQKLDANTKDVEPAEEEDRIHLQDFLNMTSIRFIELNTTKRRHTVVPNSLLTQSGEKAGQGDEDTDDAKASNELEHRVVAGACTIPMLELYQHSCRELKNYISEGRSIVKEIEADTYEDNPPLFREYMSAPADVRPIMDNQFKNVKTHARLLSKAMWYEWRMKLLEGLKEGLLKISEGMEDDDRLLIQQEQLIQPVLPPLIEEQERLEGQVSIAQAQAVELANCDQDELKEARDSLRSIERDLEAKKRLVEELQSQLREREDGLADVVERKQECMDEIKEAEKIRSDCRGWSATEISALQANVTTLEDSYGWTIVSAAESALTMTYDHTLQLFFNPSSFKSNESAAMSDTSPISLTYIADAHEYHPQPLTTEKRFFLQIMRAQLQCLQQSQIRVKDLLAYIGSSWKIASTVAEKARVLGIGYTAEPTITSDEVMAIRSFILLVAMRTKVEVVFEVKVRSGEDVAPLNVVVKSSAKVSYGESLNEKKMGEFLESKVNGKKKGAKERGVWVKAVRELEERLIARGKK